MTYPFKFRDTGSLEALLYIAGKVERPTLHKAFKVLYFADRYHVENYGRLISGDQYVAMRDGPVPSRIYDLAKEVREQRGRRRYAEAIEIHDNHKISLLREADTEYLSNSDIDALDYAISNYGHLTWPQLKKISHDQSYHHADASNRISIKALTLGMSNRDELLEHLEDRYA